MSKEEYEISLQKYENDLLKGVDDLKKALKYYIEKTKNLEKENKLLWEMYENRVNKYLKDKER